MESQPPPPPPPPPSDADLLAQWRAGAQGAAAELVCRYAPGLLALVRRRLSARLAARVDAEDVVQSALKSFFVAVRDDGLAAGHGGELWRLLVAVTLNKLHKVVRRHVSGKRSVHAEVGPADEAGLGEALAGARDQLSPLETLAIVDELETALARLPEDRRPILEMRLAGYELEAIAEAVGCSQRTVRRVLAGVRQELERDSQSGTEEEGGAV